jgi:hypothetical protein
VISNASNAEHRLDEKVGVPHIVSTRARHQSSNVLEMSVEAAHQFLALGLSGTGRFGHGLLPAK